MTCFYFIFESLLWNREFKWLLETLAFRKKLELISKKVASSDHFKMKLKLYIVAGFCLNGDVASNGCVRGAYLEPLRARKQMQESCLKYICLVAWSIAVLVAINTSFLRIRGESYSAPE